MAKSKTKPPSEIEETIIASTYGLSQAFVNKNAELVEQSSSYVSDLVSKHGFTNNKSKGANPIETLANAVQSTLRYSQNETGAGNRNGVSGTGIRSIQFDSLSPGESELIQGLSRVLQDRFTLMPEYRSVVAIIPELRRVISLIARDIINRDEFSKRSLKNLYTNEMIRDAKILEKVNKKIDEEIVERYNLETKLRRWVEASLIEGAHPIAIYPYKTIFEQVLSIPGASVKMTAKKSSESASSELIANTMEFSEIDIPKSDNENFYTPSLFGRESCFVDDGTYRDLTDRTKEHLKRIIDDDLAEELYDEMANSIESTIQHINRKTEPPLFGTDDRSSEAVSPDIVNRIQTALKDGRKSANIEKRNELVRAKIAPLVEVLDQNIKFVDPSKAGVDIARKNLRRTQDVARFHGKNSDGTPMAMFSSTSPDASFQRGGRDTTTSPREEIVKNWEKSGLNREVLIVEYDPELTIPVVVAGEHVGYYVLEFEAFYGPEYRARKKIGSFTDLVKGLGMGDDKSVISTMNAVGDTDPLSSSLFTPLPMVAGSQMMMNSVQGMTDEDRKMETLKRVVLQTISEKVKDKGIVDDKRFKDAIAGLIRNGHIVNKKIILSYIPADNMVYFARKLDLDGMPISILDGTLLYCYMYISSKISSAMIKLMKSADKEKILVNMGMTGQLNYTMSEIEKSLSTRNVNVQSFFSNVGQVIRNSATYQKMKIPVVDGEQLFDVQQIERVNDLSPDDDFTEKLLRSILLTIGVQSSMLNSLDDNEYSRSIVVQNLEYRANILDSQTVFESDTTKLIRILAKYASIELPSTTQSSKNVGGETNENKKEKINLDDINVRFTVPTFLSVASINDQISSAQTLVDSIVAIMVGDASDDNFSNLKIKLLKRELYKLFANTVDWKEMNDTLTSIEGNVINEALKMAKETKIIKKMKDDEDYDPATDAANNGGGGGGGGGGGMDGGFGGDDFGGGDTGGGFGDEGSTTTEEETPPEGGSDVETF